MCSAWPCTANSGRSKHPAPCSTWAMGCWRFRGVPKRPRFPRSRCGSRSATSRPSTPEWSSEGQKGYAHPRRSSGAWWRRGSVTPTGCGSYSCRSPRITRYGGISARSDTDGATTNKGRPAVSVPEALGRKGPLVPVTGRKVALGLHGCGHDVAQHSEVALKSPCGTGLDQEVAHRGAFGGTCHYRKAHGSGGEPARQAITRTTTDHAHHIHAGPTHVRAPVYRSALAPGQGIHHAASECGVAGEWALSGLLGIVDASGAQVPRGQEAAVVHVHGAGEGGHLGGARHQVGQVGFVACLPPGAQRLLQEPQAGDVTQVAHGAVDPELVGEVGGPALLRTYRPVEFDTDQ